MADQNDKPMIGAVSATQPATARRGRILRRLAPFVALGAIAISFAIHHTELLDEHDLGATLLTLAVAAVAVFAFAALARATDQPLPVVITLRPGGRDVREIREEDLNFCAALHAETLPHGFFVALGRRFLRAYLATFVASPHAVALLLTVNRAPVGMVVGILQPRAHARWVMRHRGIRLALLGGLALATRPLLALRFVNKRFARYRRAWGRRSAEPAAEPGAQPAVLSHVAVAPGAQGAGFGAQLVDAFVDEARRAGASEVILVTFAGAAGATGFYRSLGWVESGLRRDFDGASIVEFTLPLEDGKR